MIYRWYIEVSGDSFDCSKLLNRVEPITQAKQEEKRKRKKGEKGEKREKGENGENGEKGDKGEHGKKVDIKWTNVKPNCTKMYIHNFDQKTL